MYGIECLKHYRFSPSFPLLDHNHDRHFTRSYMQSNTFAVLQFSVQIEQAVQYKNYKGNVIDTECQGPKGFVAPAKKMQGSSAPRK